MGIRPHEHEQRRQEALRDLDRLSAQSDVIGTSALQRAADHARNHMMGMDGDTSDPVEIWGRRIGRFLSLAFFAALLWYLAKTYLY